MSSKQINCVLLTGNPGVGKTTAIQKICNILKTKNIPAAGFYTKEVRNDSKSRIGFDIVTLDNKTGVLARIKDKNANVNSKFSVGNYAVYINEFESLVLPLFKQQKTSVFIIDEIGKMELFSTHFKTEVMNLFHTPNILIIATIPVTNNRPIPFIEKLKTIPNIMITVDRTNRDNVPAEILSCLNIN